MKKYDVLLEYFHLEFVRLENEVKQLQENIKWRRISTIDCLELIIAQERLAAFLEFRQHVKAILKLQRGENDEDF